MSLLSFFANAQVAPSGFIARDDSGQFIVTGPSQISRLANSPSVVTNPDFIRLEPAILAVSAERIKESLWHELGINSVWRGEIFLALHPAQSLDENVTIVSERSPNGWNYHVALPDILTRDRFMRTMTSVVLLEYANRNANTHSAEIPAWLTDGLSQQRLVSGTSEIILSSPNSIVNSLQQNSTIMNEHGMDPLSDAKRVLDGNLPLTFEQLNWPTEAQLFVSDLLELKNGASHLRRMLEALPYYYNWQTAFQIAFHPDFPRPLDVEKWWALQNVGFVALERDSAWTPAISREKLDEILSVSADVRFASNALPVRASISLQTVIRNLDDTLQTEVLQNKLCDLQLAQFRMSLQFAVLADGYGRILADYLKQRGGGAETAENRRSQASSLKILTRDTIKKLDALDARRQAIETVANSDEFIQPDLVQKNF
ncbi:MAG: hypothetical protein ABSG87_07460 [Verrucomicrobiota bacterium]